MPLERLRGAAAATAVGLQCEATDCLLCGSSRASTLVEAEDGDRQGFVFRVVRCDRCGLCFTSPRPAPTRIDQFYPVDYEPHRRARLPRPRLSDWLRPFRARDPERDGPARHGQGRLLDVGCGSGSFLLRAQCAGWSVVGLDISTQAVDYVRDTLRLPALPGSLPHPAIPPESFDVVTSWQCLEHVYQPLELLREAHRVLVPGGRLYVTVPNIASAPFRWFGPDWFGLDVPRHLIHFTPDTLQNMLAAGGFHLQSLRLQRRTSWVRESARLSRRRGDGCFQWLRARWLARVASWYAHLRRQSDSILAVAVKPQ